MTAAAITPQRKVRPFYWSLRRELWEHRSVLFAPAVVVVVVFVGFLFSAIGMPHRRLDTLKLDTVHQMALISEPYVMANMALSLTAFLVSVVFCLSATYNERRDRTILFWKSLPVSDTTTVLAKAAVPFVVLPIVALASILAAEASIWVSSSVILSMSGVSAALPWSGADIAGNGVALAYGLVVDVLWLGPIFAWLMLVAGWARRGPFLWAVIPPLALCLLERVALGTHYLWTLLSDRLGGGQFHGFDVIPGTHGMSGHPKIIPGLAGVDVAKLLSDPGLWIGLLLTAAMLALTIWLRRRRDPA